MMPKAILALYFVLALKCLVYAQEASEAQIKEDTTIAIGEGTIRLRAGTQVQVLLIKGNRSVISCSAPDGSPVITEIGTNVLEFAIDRAPPAPANPLNLSGNRLNSSSAGSATNSESFPPSPGPVIANKMQPLEKALLMSGGNRKELEAFLAQHNTPDARLLITTARQSDLVNLTGKLLSDDLETTDKAKAGVKWADRIPSDLWQQFVLPYRVADEPLDDFKPEFYEKLYPIVSSATESGEAALLVHHWLWNGDGGMPRIFFKVTENRDQQPRMLLDETKIGRCFEMNLLCVALLRSVGIPSRIAGASFWMNNEFYHYWVEYYDTKSSSWLYYQGSVSDPESFMGANLLFKKASQLKCPTVYALPGFCAVTDPIGKERWNALINTTTLYAPTGTIHCSAYRSSGGSPPRFSVYVWNLSAWRIVEQSVGDGEGEARLTVASNEYNYPYLVSIALDGKLLWGMVKVAANDTTEVSDSALSRELPANIIPVVESSPIGKKPGVTEQ